MDASTRIITTVAGKGWRGSPMNGIPAVLAGFEGATSVALDGAGNLYFAEPKNHHIRRVDASTGIITTIAGNYGKGDYRRGPAIKAGFGPPTGLVLDSKGALLFAAMGLFRIFKIDPGSDGKITGTGDEILNIVVGSEENVGSGLSGDGGPASKARLASPSDVVMDRVGDLYIADKGNNRIRRVE